MATRAEWAKLVEEWRKSGEDRDRFAERRGVKATTFQWWVSKLARDARGRTQSTSAVRFAKVTRRRASEQPPGAVAGVGATTTSTLDLVLPRGCSVRITAGFDPRLLARVLDALEVR